jgi:hypothetical protein
MSNIVGFCFYTPAFEIPQEQPHTHGCPKKSNADQRPSADSEPMQCEERDGTTCGTVDDCLKPDEEPKFPVGRTVVDVVEIVIQ